MSKLAKALSTRSVQRFHADEHGTVAMIFAFSLIPIMAFIGSTVDFSRAVMARSNLQQATDATILAVSKYAQEGSSSAQIKTLAAAYLKATSPDIYAAIDGDVTISADKTTVCMVTTSRINTAVMQLFHINQIALRSSACTVTNNANFEIAMVLDTTGSMASSDGTNSKIASLRSAATQFVDYMFNSATLGSRVKISMVPFSSAVNVDPSYRTASWVDTNALSSWHWTSPLFTGQAGLATSRFSLYTKLKAVNSNWDWKGCLEEQPYPMNVVDTAPTSSNPDSLFVPMLAPDEPDSTYTNSSGKTKSNPYSYQNNYLDDFASVCVGQPTGTTLTDETTKQARVCKYYPPTKSTTAPTTYGPQYGCVADPLQRMTTSATTLKTKINALQAQGNTNIHQGFMWGWRTLSPNVPFADGQPYGAPNVIKIIVLMTDGMNTWTDTNSPLDGSEYGPYGYYNSANGRLPPANRNVTTATAARNAIDALSLEACANARAAGIIVYTVGFSVKNDPIDAQGLQLLKDCAGNTTRALVATSSSSLTDVFAQIATSIGTLRLTN